MAVKRIIFIILCCAIQLNEAIQSINLVKKQEPEHARCNAAVVPQPNAKSSNILLTSSDCFIGYDSKIQESKFLPGEDFSVIVKQDEKVLNPKIISSMNNTEILLLKIDADLEGTPLSTDQISEAENCTVVGLVRNRNNLTDANVTQIPISSKTGRGYQMQNHIFDYSLFVEVKLGAPLICLKDSSPVLQGIVSDVRNGMSRFDVLTQKHYWRTDNIEFWDIVPLKQQIEDLMKNF